MLRMPRRMTTHANARMTTPRGISCRLRSARVRRTQASNSAVGDGETHARATLPAVQAVPVTTRTDRHIMTQDYVSESAGVDTVRRLRT